MANLFCFGLGYSAAHYIAEYGGRFWRIAGTVRTREKAAAIASGALKHPVEAFVFDGSAAKPEIDAAVMDATAILVSAPPDESDPVLRHFADTIAAAPHLRSIVYLSTIGVYGDHAGEWVDETTAPAPVSERSRARLAAEQAWIALGGRAEKAVAILRLSGIYGPGQNAFTQLKSGRAKRIDKAGQFFNRIHVADIAQTIDAAVAKSANGVINVTDDKPTAQGVPVAFAAELLGIEPPRQIPFADAAAGMNEMALSFYRESKRVDNTRMKRELGVTLRYPTFREGLHALAAGEKNES